VQGSGGNGSAYEFSLEDSDSSTPNATANIAFRAGNTFTVAAPTTGSDVYTISVRDDRNCTPPNTTTDSASDLCAVAASPVTVTIDVTGTPGFSYRLLREGVAVGATVPVASITAPATSGSFTVDLPNPSATAVTNYEIFVSDLRHPNTACEIRIPISINPPVTIGTINRNQPDCRPSGTVPTSGATVNFAVSGGTGTYVYTVINNSDSNADITADPGVAQTGSNANPTFGFSDAFDGDNIEIIITDNAATPCPAGRIPFTPMYPTAPIVDSEVFDPAKCFGGSSRFTVNLPTGANLNDFTFYSVENNATGCITSGSSTIQEPSIITEFLRNINPSSCDVVTGNTDGGGFRLAVAGGFINNPAAPIAPPFPTPGNQAAATYTFVLREQGNATPITPPTTVANPVNPVISNNGTNTSVEYFELDPGIYEVEAILNDSDGLNANNCRNTFTFILPSQPFVEVVNTQFNSSNCSAGVELYIVIDGGADPTQFEMRIDRSELPADFINPGDTDTDYISRLRDPDFLETDPLPAGPPAIMIPIIVRDQNTLCETESTINAPASEDIVVDELVASANTGSCTPPSGEATVTFSITDGLFGDYEIQLQRGGNVPDDPSERVVVEVVDPSTNPLGPNQVTGTRNTSVVPNRIEGISVTLEGLPEILATENAIIRVSQIGSPNCSDVSGPVVIGMDDPVALGVTTLPGDCENGARLFLSATGGNSSYRYIVVNPNDPEPDALTPFPISTPPEETIPIDLNNLDSRIDTAPASAAEIATNPLFGQDNFIGRVRVAVISANCVESQLVPINFNRRPILDLVAVTSGDCTDGPYEISYTINDFDPSQSYTLTVNGNTTVTIYDPVTNTSGVTITGTAPNEVAQSVTPLTVNDGRRNYIVEVSGSANGNCTTTDNIEIFPALTVVNTPSAARCDDQFDTIRVEVTGGFESAPSVSIPNRQLFYELIDISTNSVIASQTSTSTDITFTNDAGTVLDFLADTVTRYRVRVTDRELDVAGALVLRSCDREENVPEVLPVVVPTFTLAQNEVTCPLDNDGSVTFTITNPGNTPQPPSFRLYQFGTLAEANAAIAAANGVASDYSMVNGTLINNLTNNTNYPGLTAGPYVGFLETQRNGLY